MEDRSPMFGLPSPLAAPPPTTCTTSSPAGKKYSSAGAEKGTLTPTVPGRSMRALLEPLTATPPLPFGPPILSPAPQLLGEHSRLADRGACRTALSDCTNVMRNKSNLQTPMRSPASASKFSGLKAADLNPGYIPSPGQRL